MRSTLTRVVAATAAAGLLCLGGPQADAGPPAAAQSNVARETPARAGGAVTLGRVATSLLVICSSAPDTITQYTSVAGEPSYTTPSPGVITSFSVAAGAVPGAVRLLLLGPSPTPTHRTVVFKEDVLHPVTVNTINTFAVRVPAAAGLLIGVTNSASNMTCAGAGSAGDDARVASFDPQSSNDYPGSSLIPDKLANISAVLEPDVDHDQFGDISQDQCPESALTQAACPAPDTTIVKAPKKRTTKRKLTIRFSSVAGATFTCAVDRKAPLACTSPFRKKYKLGKHTVRVTARSAFGIVDPTPATVTFKVKRARIPK